MPSAKHIHMASLTKFMTSKNWIVLGPKDIEIARLMTSVGGDILEGEGSISARFDYPDRRSILESSRSTFTYSEKWRAGTDGKVELRVIDFVLPTRLRRRGVGTLCWSAIHSTLAEALATEILLRGSLSSVDGVMHDPRSNPDFLNLGQLEQIPNVERRNRFWQRMLDPVDQHFECDEKGDGWFKGTFVDPAKHESFSSPVCLIPVDHAT